MTAWAKTLEFDMGRAGVRIIPAHGADATHLVARLVDVVFPGTTIAAVLDGDTKGDATARKLRDAFGDRILVRQWTARTIEASPRGQRVVEFRSLQTWEGAASAGRNGQPCALDELTDYLFGNKSFHKVRAGGFIADQMTRVEIPSEVVARMAEVLTQQT